MRTTIIDKIEHINALLKEICNDLIEDGVKYDIELEEYDMTYVSDMVPRKYYNVHIVVGSGKENE